MRAYTRPGFLRSIVACFGIVAVGGVVAGCSSGSPEVTKADEAKMRAEMTKKGPVNMNNLPADQREKIQKFFQQQGNTPGGQANGSAGQKSGGSQ
jgi:hypothetical protein